MGLVAGLPAWILIQVVTSWAIRWTLDTPRAGHVAKPRNRREDPFW